MSCGGRKGNDDGADKNDDDKLPAEAMCEGGADAPKLTYFAGIRSRGEPPQIIAAYGGVKITVELIDFDEWVKRKSDKLPYLPYITQPDGSVLLETEAICKHIAELGGKFVVNAKTEELCKIANSPPLGLADPLYNLPDGGASKGVPALEAWIEMVGPKLKELVEQLGDGPFFAGEVPGYGEAGIFHVLCNIFALAKAEITATTGEEVVGKLEAFHSRFAALNGVKEYLAMRPTAWGVPGSKANPIIHRL